MAARESAIAAGVPKRPLGRTGHEVSLVGLGGFHLGKIRSRSAAVRLVHAAIERGVTFLDNAWDYHDGESESRVGAALRDGYRGRAFVMTKLDGRTRKAAEKQLHESLKRLHIERVDLVQLHEVIRFEDADRAFASDGAIEALVAARAAGKVRFIGFTGHKDPAVHLTMLEVARAHGFEFDTVQMPLNVMDAHFRSFERRVLPEALSRGVGVIAMKSMAAGKIVAEGRVTATECLHYTMNLPVSVVVTGIESEDQLDQAVLAAQSFRALAPDDVSRLLAHTEEAARSGRIERFKTTAEHDSTAQHPEWLG